MPLTRDFRETVRARARREPEFREMLLASSVRCLLGGEVSVAAIILRDYIETTISYEKLGALTGTPPDSLAVMFKNADTATEADLLKVVRCMQRHEGNQFEVKVVPVEADEEEEETEVQMETAAAAAR